MGKKGDPLSKIRADIEKRYEKSLKEFAEEMTFEIESAYETIIQKFYEDYSPRYYQRTYQTYNASNRYDDPTGYTPIEGGYEAGIILDPSFMDGNPYRADKNWVYDRTFNQGIHGFFKAEMNEWKENRMVKIQTDYVLNGISMSFKEYLARERKKAPLNIKKIPKRVTIKIMTGGTPRAAMDKTFKALTKKSNMDIIFNAILTNNFSK